MVKHCFDKVHHRIKQKRLENDWKHNRFHLIPKIEKIRQDGGASVERMSPKTGRRKSKSPLRASSSKKKKKKRVVPGGTE